MTVPHVSGVPSEVETSPFSFCALILTILVFRMNSKFFISFSVEYCHYFFFNLAFIFVSNFQSDSPPFQRRAKNCLFRGS